jgi:hypothetical protein
VNVVERHGGWIRWARRGQEVGSIGYELHRDEMGAPVAVTMSYTITPRGGEPKDYRYRVDIVSRVTAADIRQRFSRCPLARSATPRDRLVRTIYLPPGGVYFGCRHCYGLVYAKCQEHDKRFDYLAALMRGDLQAALRFQPAYERRFAATRARVDLP